jgi:hypothetical protein
LDKEAVAKREEPNPQAKTFNVRSDLAYLLSSVASPLDFRLALFMAQNLQVQPEDFPLPT